MIHFKPLEQAATVQGMKQGNKIGILENDKVTKNKINSLIPTMHIYLYIYMRTFINGHVSFRTFPLSIVL